MKTTEELNAIKAEIEALSAKLAELSEEELMQVAGGTRFIHPPLPGRTRIVEENTDGTKGPIRR